MADDPLLPTQKQAFAGAMTASGIPIEEFEIVAVDSEWVGLLDDSTPAVRHKPTQFTFAYYFVPSFADGLTGQHDAGGFACAFRPGEHTPAEHRFHLTWDLLHTYFLKWLGLVKREANVSRPGTYPTSEPPTPALAPRVEAQWGHSAPSPFDPGALPLLAVTPPSPQATAKTVWSSIEGWLAVEAKRRGRFWTVLGAIVAILIAAIALF